ncbi:MAG: STAS domain-containing protein [Thermodesulfobacteriota bacterium]
MEIEVRSVPGAAIIAAKGRLDAVTVTVFESELTGLLSGGPSRLIVNLTDLEYISSAGLRAILACSKKLQAKQGRLILVGLRGMVEEVFRMAGFLELLPVAATEAEALSKS